MSEWLPTYIAPLRTEVLLWREDCGQFIGSFTQASSFPMTQDEIDALDDEAMESWDWFSQWPDARRLDGSEAPTFWRPLPDDPLVDKSSEMQDSSVDKTNFLHKAVKALQSIAANTCCKGCQEAAIVAREALKDQS